MIETVKGNCKHPDCKYRGSFNFQPCCQYMIVTGNPRNCSISECDKYKAGKLEVKHDLGGYRFAKE